MGMYDNIFNQYMSLPTNLQNYTGGMGPSSLMGRQPQPGGGMGTPMTPPQQPGVGGMPMGMPGVMGGFNMNPYMAQSPYAAMGGMGMGGMPPGMGGPMQPQSPGAPLTGTDYNAMAAQLAGVPEGGQKSDSAKKFAQQLKELREKLHQAQKQIKSAPTTRGNKWGGNKWGGGGEGAGSGPSGGSGAGGQGAHGGGGSGHGGAGGVSGGAY